LLSSAAHSLLLAQETAYKGLRLILRALRARLPPVGSVEVSTLPAPSTAAQNPLLVHETA